MLDREQEYERWQIEEGQGRSDAGVREVPVQPPSTGAGLMGSEAARPIMEIWGLVLNIVLLASVSFDGWCASDQPDCHFPNRDCDYEFHCSELSILFYAFSGILYIVYLWEAFFKSPTGHCLSNFIIHVNVFGHVARLSCKPPSVVIRAEAFHYSKGKYSKKIVTWSDSRDFHFDKWRNASDPLHLVSGYPLVQLILGREITCEDRYTDECLKRQRDEFKKPINVGDDHYKVFIDTGETSRFLCLNENARPPCGVGLGWYTFFTLIGLSWPYRMYIQSMSVEVEHCVRKSIQVSAMGLPSGGTSKKPAKYAKGLPEV